MDAERNDPVAGAAAVDAGTEDHGPSDDPHGPGASSAKAPSSNSAKVLEAIANEFDYAIGGDGEGYVTLERAGHAETWLIRSSAFRTELRKRFHDLRGTIPPTQPLLDLIDYLDGRTQQSGRHRDVFNRVGRLEDHIFLDRGDESFGVIEINRTGYRELSRSPICFRRNKGMMPLPVPRLGGSLRNLRRILNVADETQFILLCGWLLATLRGTGPYPLLVLSGEQGTAKSTFARFLKKLVDPTRAPLQSIPRSIQDLAINASGSLIAAYDNISTLSPWLSDALCRVATGEGLTTRKLYSDSEPMIFELSRPLLLTGIEDFASRPDLMDRTIFLRLSVIEEAERRTEAELQAEFDEMHPLLLGALLDGVVMALRNEATTTVSKLPRMADAARWVIAAEPALPWEPGAFLRAYEANRASATDDALENNPVATTILKYLEISDFSGSPTELYVALSVEVSEEIRRSWAWPKSPQSLSGQLSRLGPALRARGLVVETHRTHAGRRIVLENPARDPSEASRRHFRRPR